MSQVTAHERMLAAYRHEKLPGLPVVTYTGYLPRGDREREVRNLGIGVIAFYPVVTVLSPPWHKRESYLSEVPGADYEILFTFENGEPIETRTYRTPVGTISQKTRKDPMYGSGWIYQFYIQSLEDYRVVQYLIENTILKPNFADLEAQIANMGGDGVILGRMDRCPYQKLLIELAGPERFLIDLYTTPEPVVKLLEAMDRRMDEAYEIAMGSPAEVIWQPDNITADMTPPKMFRKYLLPYYEKHGQQCQRAGKPYIVHMDGRTRALRNLIAQAPIDVIESFSLPIIGGDQLYAEARAAWPGKLILPNFPSSLCMQSEEAVHAFLDDLMAQVPVEQPFMLQISEDIPSGEWRRVLPLLADYFMQRTETG